MSEKLLRLSRKTGTTNSVDSGLLLEFEQVLKLVKMWIKNVPNLHPQ